jgi:hypothetical protein
VERAGDGPGRAGHAPDDLGPGSEHRRLVIAGRSLGLALDAVGTVGRLLVDDGAAGGGQ